jgi:hypothetical protein
MLNNLPPPHHGTNMWSVNIIFKTIIFEKLKHDICITNLQKVG